MTSKGNRFGITGDRGEWFKVVHSLSALAKVKEHTVYFNQKETNFVQRLFSYTSDQSACFSF